MTRQEIRDQFARELSVDAERLINAELTLISKTDHGRYESAVAVIHAMQGMRLIGLERSLLLIQQAKQISQARKAQLEIQP